MKKFIGNTYGNTYTPLDAGPEFVDNGSRIYGACGGRTLSGELTEEGGGGGRGPVAIFEAPLVNTDNARQEYVTECNSCSYYNRGECGRTGLAMTPDDYCSKAVPAEA